MSDSKGSGDKTISVSKKTISLKTGDGAGARPSLSRGGSKGVVVEKKRKRLVMPADGEKTTKKPETVKKPVSEAPKVEKKPAAKPRPKVGAGKSGVVLRSLSEEEKAARAQALTQARAAEAEARKQAEIDAVRQAEEDKKQAAEQAEAAARQAEEDVRRKEEEEARKKAEADAKRREEAARIADAEAAASKATSEKPSKKETVAPKRSNDDDGDKNKKGKLENKPAGGVPSRKGTPGGNDRRRGKLTLRSALEGDEERQRSLASIRRKRQKEKMASQQNNQSQEKQVREVVVPETITVAELANRMAERGAAVVKSLMGMGVMATINQAIDADTAELLIEEFGHKIKRVSDSDVEIGLKGEEDEEGDLQPRAPVVTIMGHVDHGKTSLLDALRRTDVAGGEAGGITQHIGAYQIKIASGDKITFLDTPGHEAFTAMRARGASVTDVVVLVVAADDGVMPQTVEAINHAKEAAVPIIVAINKMDKPEANPNRVNNELLQHELVVEEMGGDILTVPVSAKTGEGLEKLEEAILLQAEILELQANPDRKAEGVIVEAKLDKGRGPVATVLVQKGTLSQGDIFVAGSEWGRVRALVDDRSKQIDQAGPSFPVEVLGLQGTPEAGDDFAVVENEARAREITDYRQRLKREKQSTAVKGTTLDQMLVNLKAQENKIEFPILVKADVQGSAEAINGALEKLGNDEISVRVIHNAVGGITESDVTFAEASNAPIIAFNVRANRHARDQAERNGVEIRYYSVIYDLVDDVKKAMAGLLSPEIRETFLGYADIREVFHISKIGKVAGCLVTEGTVKRGAKVRLLRDNVVIHEGTLSTLKRFKDEVKEVPSGTECGMAFENYQDLQPGDVIECFDAEEVARTL